MEREKKNIFEYAGISKKKEKKKLKAPVKNKEEPWYFKCNNCGKITGTKIYVKVPVTPRECSGCGCNGTFDDVTENLMKSVDVMMRKKKEREKNGKRL